MKKILRFIIGAVIIAIGIAGVIFAIYLFAQGVDIVTGVVYVALAAVSLSVVGLGWVVITGGSVKDAMQDVISGISF